MILPGEEEAVLRVSGLSFRKRELEHFECAKGTTQLVSHDVAFRCHLFDTLALLSRPGAGSLLLGARPLQRPDLALLGQSPSLPQALTATEFLIESNLACATNERDARATLMAFGLREKCDTALGSMSPLASKAVVLVATLASKRPVKVLHEPLSGLAPEVVPYVKDALLSMRHGICIVITENALPLAQVAHRTVHLLSVAPPRMVAVVIVADEIEKLTAHLEERKLVYEVRGNTVRIRSGKLSEDLPVLQRCILAAGILVHSLSIEQGAV
jgi:ABC-type transport system involved in cytochrome c biogenesis ATPase subunit